MFKHESLTQHFVVRYNSPVNDEWVLYGLTFPIDHLKWTLSSMNQFRNG